MHTHAFDCEKDYNDWRHLWSGAHQRYCGSEKNVISCGSGLFHDCDMIKVVTSKTSPAETRWR